jgi:preprotein translocase subunit SecG
MLIFFGILLVLICALLGLFVLVQNPKGGGLSGSFGGIGTQVIGVRNTTNVMEKGTWYLATILAILCLVSPSIISMSGGSGSGSNSEIIRDNTAPAAAPAMTLPEAGAPALESTTPAQDSSN